MQVLLDRQKFVFYNPTATTAAAAREKYKTDVEKWFARPAECNMVAFRSYFEEYTVTPKQLKRVTYHQDGFGNYVHHNCGGDKLVHVESAKFGTDQWHARLLLLQPDCFARSWKEVRTVDGIEHPTFSDATKARGLLDTHEAAVATIAETLTSHLHTPQRARVLLLLVCCDISILETSYLTWATTHIYN
jgi:hypothetical protein